MKILCPDPESFSDIGLKTLSKSHDVFCKKIDQVEFDKVAPNYDVILTRFNTQITEKVINQKSNIKFILSPTTGLDHIDLNAAQKMNIKVFHLKGQRRFLRKISGTAELTIGLIISISRNIPESFESVKNFNWNTHSFMGHELYKKKLGIIGYGRLGRKVARVASSLDMDILCFDPYINHIPRYVNKVDNLNSLLSTSDYVSIHIPLNSETKHLISYPQIQKMKPESFIINTSRGSIINTHDLLKALENKTIRGAALDVIEDEWSLIAEGKSFLIDYAKHNRNLIITPHIGGATFESIERTDMFIIDKFLKFLY